MSFRSFRSGPKPGNYRIQTIADCWAKFRETAIPATAPEQEVERARIVFYAGVAYMFDQSIAAVDPSMTEKQSQAHLQSISDELKAFALAIAARDGAVTH